MSSDQPQSREEDWTCGKGLAHHSAIPASMARFLAALADVLRTHGPTIDTTSPEGRAEWEAYDELTKSYTGLAEELARTASRMSGYVSLPAAPHHEEALADPHLVDVFAAFVKVESDLADLLRRSADDDLEMLSGW